MSRWGLDLETQDELKCTALHSSAEKGHTAIVQMLLESKANTEAQDKGAPRLPCGICR